MWKTGTQNAGKSPKPAIDKRPPTIEHPSFPNIHGLLMCKKPKQVSFRKSCDATITNPTKEENKEITSGVASPEILGGQNV